MIYQADATEEGIDQLVDEFLEIIKLYIIPTFDKYNDIRTLDAFINEKPAYYFEVIHLSGAEGLRTHRCVANTIIFIHPMY